EGSNSKRASVRKGAIVMGTISEVTPDEVIVDLGNGGNGVIRRTDLSMNKDEQNTAKFKVGESVEASVVAVEDGVTKLSIRAMQAAMEKQAVKEYSKNADSGAVLGDILGAAFDNAKK
ncbi:MAG: S1 RNA-binding domain-containing protein, partial [Alphaproteobacteria bacterium]|nr:S1 RNA-binding domain-containing protein [Alphaproteobacteria bacterium]